MIQKPLTVCYFGTYRTEYSRNKLMIAALRTQGVNVLECHVPLWHGIEDRVAITAGGWKNPKFWWRAFRVYLQLILLYFRMQSFDILMVGYPGQFDVYLAKALSWLHRKPLVWDVFMSIYLITLERSLDSKSRITVNALYHIEKVALRLPDLLIQDTDTYVNWFHETYGIPKERFRLVPTGADDRIFSPSHSIHQPKNDSHFVVLYYGTFIPNHGVRYIIEAARLLSSHPEITSK